MRGKPRSSRGRRYCGKVALQSISNPGAIPLLPSPTSSPGFARISSYPSGGEGTSNSKASSMTAILPLLALADSMLLDSAPSSGGGVWRGRERGGRAGLRRPCSRPAVSPASFRTASCSGGGTAASSIVGSGAVSSPPLVAPTVWSKPGLATFKPAKLVKNWSSSFPILRSDQNGVSLLRVVRGRVS